MYIKIEYVDGTATSGLIENWPYYRSDGVMSITVVDPITGKPTILRGYGIYWAYPEDNNWVIGCGSVNNPTGDAPPEVEITDDGILRRKFKFMPDLSIDKVKLGWWISETYLDWADPVYVDVNEEATDTVRFLETPPYLSEPGDMWREKGLWLLACPGCSIVLVINNEFSFTESSISMSFGCRICSAAYDIIEGTVYKREGSLEEFME